MKIDNEQFRKNWEKYKANSWQINKEYWEINNYLFNSVVNMISESEPRFTGIFSYVSHFLLQKCQKTHWSILLLCREGFGEDAGMLLRTLLETLINFLWMSNANKDERVNSWIYYDYILRKRLIDSIEKWKPLEKGLEINIYDKNEVERKYQSVKDKYKKGKGWSGKNTEQMAMDVGLEYDYEFVYRYFSNLGHSSARSAGHYVSVTEDLIEYNIFSQAGVDCITKVLHYSYWYMLLIVTKWNEFLECGQLDKVKELWQKMKVLPHYERYRP